MRRSAFLPTLLVLACALPSQSCGGSSDAKPSPELILARDLASDLGLTMQWEKAREVLAPFVAAKDAAAEDLLRAAMVELSMSDEGRLARARPLVETAAKRGADPLVLLWMRYWLAHTETEAGGDSGLQLPPLRELHASRPDDYQITLALASVLFASDDPARKSELEPLLRPVLALKPEVTGVWRMSALYMLATTLQRTGREEEAKPLFDEFKLFEARDVKTPGAPTNQPGTLGMLRPHTPTHFDAPAPSSSPAGMSDARTLASATEARAFACVELDWDALLVNQSQSAEEHYTWEPQRALVWAGESGVRLYERDETSENKADKVTSLCADPVLDFAPFDRMNHGADKSTDPPDKKKSGDRDLDLLLVTSANGRARLRLLENVGGSWSLRAEPLAELPPIDGPGRLTVVDYDHDGDVDLLVSAASGPLLLRNDGLDGTGGFTDATASAGLPRGEFRVITEDFDRDSDVDLLFVERASGALHLASNERGGVFSDASASLPAGLHGQWVVAADFDGDAWPDLALVNGAEIALYTRTELGGWRAEPRRFTLASAPSGEPRAVDWDLDGLCDLVWPCAETPAAALLAPGFVNGGAIVPIGKPFVAPAAGPAAIELQDVDEDHDLDLVRLDASGLVLWPRAGTGEGLTLALQGYKDNARAVGSVVELRAGLLYRRFYYRGTPELVAFGTRPLDVVRVTWPNGVVQSVFGLWSRSSTLLAQRKALPGSCPFLYTWNGKEYEFVSDVLGITPLGLPMAPGMLVPPDHDEYVLVKGEQLAPKDGAFEMHFTEELREVTYLDRIRLDVVDHPADTEVFPNERFSFPPFPEAHTHTVEDPLVPLSAVDQDGKDWKDELARNDRRFAIPFENLPGPYRGLATPYTLELAFDPARVASAAKLRLFLNGWFYWTDASVNMAVARHPDYEFIPPILSVPDGNGGWKECDSIGFPAGKLKTMAVDVSALLNRADPRIRLFSTLRLYWDSIRLATDADDAPLVTTALEPSSAKLWQRGFSRSFALLGAHDCEWFDWNALEAQPRWNQHPGLYTKLGEVLPLVGAIDDRFVVMGAGDALTVRFDATKVPALRDGWRRDYLVFLDGWAKDRDPNTIDALYVEPLPFHGMSGYPYRSDEHYPDDEAHRAYRRDWNTRPATRWIEPLVPPLAGLH